MHGTIFNIQRFSTGDGPGIRTVVFLKGCPLSCIWCHNPESNSNKTDIFFDSKKCINCRLCEKACLSGQHIFNNNTHVFSRNGCAKCAQCVDVCATQALEVCGKEITSDEVLAEVLRDKEFYDESRGGLTLSGGEPLMQYDFSLAILKKAKEKRIHTAIETSGYSCKDLTEIAQYVDLWLYDIKLFEENEHIKFTGVSNKQILENLHFLDNNNSKIILRCPIITDINFKMEHFEKLIHLANNLKNVIEIHLEPYHPLGIEKAQKLGKNQKYQNKNFLCSKDISSFCDLIKSGTAKKVIVM